MRKRFCLIFTVIMCLTLLAGCSDVTYTAPEGADVMTGSSNSVSSEDDDSDAEEADNADVTTGRLTQILDVYNEEFKLVVNYDTGEYDIGDWKITSSKYLNMSATTSGLPKGWQVYIDNVHIDSTICSLSEEYNGIQVDSMDDNTHTSMYPGFLIDDDTEYYGIFAIGGYSDTLISGFTRGYYASTSSGFGYSSGSINEERVTEADLQNAYVYGNKFQLVYDLWIQTDENETPYMKSVISEFIIPTTFNMTVSNGSTKIECTAIWNGTTFDLTDSDGNRYIMDTNLHVSYAED